MYRVGRNVLYLAALLPLLVYGEELSSICPSTTNSIDANFPDCRSKEIMLSGPRDFKQYSFKFGVDQDVSARVMVRAIVGTISMSLCSSNQCVTDDTADGPAVAKVLTQNFDLDYDWNLTISNTYGMPSKFVVEVAISNSTLMANNATQSALSSIFNSCCDVDATYNRTIGGGFPFLSACEFLHQWINAENPEDDVCQDSKQHCNSDGSLDTFTLEGAWGSTPSGNLTIIAPFKDTCLATPPPGLADLTDLTHLEFRKCGLKWKVPDIVSVTSKMKKLERLYFPYNAITGQLDQDACSIFENTSLKTLSFRNLLPSSQVATVNPPWNAISGELHQCVFNSGLENLLLMANQISSIAPIPSGVASSMQNLRLAEQTEPTTGRKTLEGKGLPKGVENLKLLSYLGLSGNKLGGSFDLAVPESLGWLDVSGNELEGSIPSLKAYSSLSGLSIGDNPELTGDITKIDMTDVPGLIYLEMSKTALEGNPNEVDWTKLPNLEWWSVSDADLEGEVPGSLAKLPFLQGLDISGNSGITSQQDFGDALTPNNTITVYTIESCNIVDLPDGLQYLFFFRANADNLYEYGWVFDISGNEIHAALPAWLANPLQTPYRTVGQYANPPIWHFAIQVEEDGFVEGNKLGCPYQPLARETVQDALQLRSLYPDDYDKWVTCYNGTQLVPVATYLTWLSTRGPLPAPPPPPPGAARASRTGAPSKTGSSGSGNKGPSAGALAGIVIGVIVGLALLALLAFVVVKYVIPKTRNRTFTKFKEADPVPVGPGPYGDPNQFQMAVQPPPPQGPNAV